MRHWEQMGNADESGQARSTNRLAYTLSRRTDADEDGHERSERQEDQVGLDLEVDVDLHVNPRLP